MDAKRLYFTRHGETQEALDSIVQGQSNSFLTANGRKNSSALGSYLSQHFTITDVITSDLARAVETAHLIFSKFNHKLEIKKEPLLREISFGVFEKRPFHLLNEFRSSAPNDLEYVKPPGGESLNGLRKRVLSWFSGFLPLSLDGSLIVTHKGPLYMIMESCHQADFDSTLKLLTFNILLIMDVYADGSYKISKTIKPNIFI
jgi:broad specificity phosphatase PhoE